MGSSPFDRLYSGNRCYFLLLRVLRCFSSPRSLRAIRAVTGSLPPGCPIRISAAVAGICPLPRLFAAYHVLRRLREPRHPPCALVYSVYLRYALRHLTAEGSFLFVSPLPDTASSLTPKGPAACGARCFLVLCRFSLLRPACSPSGLRNSGFQPCHCPCFRSGAAALTGLAALGVSVR